MPDTSGVYAAASYLRTISCVSALTLCTLLAAALSAQDVRLEDTSDWWSIINPKFPYPDTELKNKDIPAENFQIAGFNLKTVEFDQVAAKLGKTKIVHRGDASIGRSQACYVSVNESPAVHLIFEFAEDESLFYLFAGGAEWKGSDFCAKSPKVSSKLSTPSGLRLGITAARVESILGKPDLIRGNRFIYNRLFDRKTSPQEFEQMRKDYPLQLSDQEAHRKFDFYPQGLYIEVRFSDSGLNYLVISMTGTADG